MPRKARIDALGALHHIIVREINRRKIFLDDADRDDFSVYSVLLSRSY
jgi:REP-associated tyrosine transposase